MARGEARIEIKEPRLFTTRAVFVVCAYGAFLCLPVFISFLVVSLHRVGILSSLYPLLVMAATAYFLPFGFGNPYVSRLVRSLHPPPRQEQQGFIVQLTLSPRIRSGLRAMVEDADDIGYLTFSGSELVFSGDSIKLSIPFSQIKQVRLRNIGLRGLYVYGPRIVLVVPALANIESLEFAERSSCLLPASRKASRQLYERLCLKTSAANQNLI